MHCCSLATFGRKKAKSSDWFESKSKILNPIIDKKRQMQCEYNKHNIRAMCESIKVAIGPIQEEICRFEIFF